jgi:choline monooxygenase
MADALFEIDPDVRVARTLPARVYSDPDIFRLQRERIFARTWQYAAHDDVVEVAGQLYPFTLLPGALDEPLLLTRDQSDCVHCLYNVCTQRGTLVVEGRATRSSCVAAIHGRHFALDGAFQSMPEY